MDKKDDQFLKRINETFRIEAKEHLNAFSANMIELEKTQTEERHSEIIEAMFRAIHSLKGAARSVDHKEIESLCQPLESVFHAIRNKEIILSPSSFDLFYKIAERLNKLISGSGSEQSLNDRQYHRELVLHLNDITSGTLTTEAIVKPKENKEKHGVTSKHSRPIKITTGSDTPISAKPKSIDTVRIRISKLDPLLLQAEEMIQAKKSIRQRINDLQDINTCLSECKTESLKWKRLRSMESSALWKKMIDGNDNDLNKLERQLTALTHAMEHDQYNLNSMVDNHLESMRQVIMLPVSSITEAFPGMVREIAREQNKEIEFVLKGTELEIDKRILEELKDPLIHLIRNSIDHGIESAHERILLNKPPRGRIALSFSVRESGIVEISLSDDGNGINKENVLKAAIKSGILSTVAADLLDPEGILSLIYESGVSTSSIITDISGRGLGLSIVHEKVEKLNGKISVETEINKGTTFQILLPTTLATFRGILVRIGEYTLILPTINVERVMNVEQEEIKTIESHDTLMIDDQILPVADLGEVLGMPNHSSEKQRKMDREEDNSDQIRIVILISGEHRVAFRVDEVIDEQQVLIKGLGKLLNRVRNISGATILGSGKVVPVIHIADLIKSASKATTRIKVQITEEKQVDEVKRILIADDSITSRTLIKNILETAGYKITTAIDGIDAFLKAQSDVFDLIVSDVDMPGMNGFELITKIKHDKKLSELPVVLVTALGSQEDRERGIEVGADAYIIKSNFDQVNMLEIIKKLI
jgi:two-component system chemotaxis sensor kinase CheA